MLVRRVCVLVSLACAIGTAAMGCGRSTGADEAPRPGVNAAIAPVTPTDAVQAVISAYRASAGDSFPSRVKTLTYRGTIDPPQRSPFEMSFAAPGSLTRRTTYPGLAPVTVGMDGGIGWHDGPIKAVGSGARGVSPETWSARKLLLTELLGIVPAALLDGGLVQFTDGGMVELHGRPARRLLVGGIEGPTDAIYFDPSTSLVVALTFRTGPIMPDDPHGRQLVRFRNFVTIDGLQLPTVITHEWFGEGRVIATKAIDGYALNTDVDRSRFRRPASARAAQ